MNKELEQLKKEWRLFWGIAPEHSLKSRRGYDIEDWWLSKLPTILAQHDAMLLEKMEERTELFDKTKLFNLTGKELRYSRLNQKSRIYGYNQAVRDCQDIIRNNNQE